MTSHQHAERIAEQVLRKLDDFAGFDGWWSNIDADCQENIFQELISTIETNLIIHRMSVV